ncbi:uncharacterized protein LOC112562447 isoform X2 [Pomacea canaliculata]|uniref:uncharacterized protein LOC112562447 isoform X2 n=1 Tax=Pomacea canaliculata TaxID=400727 RepID=UPI000D72E3F5|nr:uncharacterized protein LOC112562447 isoform X2 [Pomacea canaliculata]
MAMGSRTGKDPAMFSNAVNDLVSISSPDPANITMDILEQQQAKEQARLLNRFRELRQWQQKQQDQLMQQQHLQLEVLRGEQLRVQMLIASQRGAQWGDGKVTKAEGFHKPSPLLMTPPHHARRGVGIGAELAKTIMTVSTDSGLVTSMGDTLEPPQDSLPKPIMYPVSPSNDEDKYTNPELFSNPGSQGDELQSLDEQCQYLDQTDGRSDASSDSFILPPVPPDPKLARLATLGHGETIC